MLKQLVQNEKLVIAAVSSNGVLEAVRHFVVSHQPEFTAMLTILQIAVALLTILHFVTKWIRAHKHKK